MLELILERIAHCRQHNVFVRIERLCGRARTASTAANEPDPQCFTG